jgi:tRNA-2-methylthio-N6-dimethylallyladenosine synthase
VVFKRIGFNMSLENIIPEQAPKGVLSSKKSFLDFLPKPQVSYPNVASRDEKYLKKVYVQTWGCQMNVADTERMLALLGQVNYRKTEDAQEADLLLLNTCHIREKARHKVVSRLGELRMLKEQDSGKIIAVAGCVAQAESKQLMKEAPYIDLIFGPDQIEKLPSLIEEIILKEEQANETLKHKPTVLAQFDKADVGYSIPIDVVPPYINEENREVSRYVNIIKGCNNFCTFCVVPYTRGREKSRPMNEILDEVKFLITTGAKEVTLLGQNVNSYGLDFVEKNHEAKNLFTRTALPFADLLYAASEVPGLERIRFTTSNPHDFTDDIVHAFRDLPKLTNAFHLPVQAGSDFMLDRMNRQYTREQYLDLVAKIRNVRPHMAFSTDIIVGFPGERDEDFEQTLSLVEQMNYAFIYAFKYSIRKGTPAARFKDQVPEDIKDKRLQKLLDMQKSETLRQNLAEINQVREVLIAYENKKQKDTWYGRTFEGRLVKVHSKENLVGKLLNVKVVDANLTALEGFIV